MWTNTFSLIDFEYFLLVLVRVASFVFAAPFFSLPNVPRRTKVGLSCFIAILVVNVMHPSEGVEYISVIGYGVLVIKEAIVGVLIGYVANICNYIIVFAGNVIDMDIGLSMATEFDASMGTQMTLTGQLYFYFMNMMLVVTGMYQYVLRAIVDSFQLIPLGGMELRTESLLLTMIQFMSDFFIISFRIILPIFASIMILNCVLGIMAKVAPQMNMFTVGIQMKIILGYVILLLVTFLFPSICDFIFREMRTMIVDVIKEITP